MPENEKHDEPGFEIGGVFYRMPTSFRLVDPVLVTEVTGMKFPAFAEAIGDEDERQDPTIMAGLIAVAVWQKNPRWKRDKVVRFVQEIPLEAVDVSGGDDEDGDVDDPPAVTPPHDGDATS